MDSLSDVWVSVHGVRDVGKVLYFVVLSLLVAGGVDNIL